MAYCDFTIDRLTQEFGVDFQGGYFFPEVAPSAWLTELVGAARFNERQQKAIPTLYGCATTGVEWQFMKLEGNVCTLDEAR